MYSRQCGRESDGHVSPTDKSTATAQPARQLVVERRSGSKLAGTEEYELSASLLVANLLAVSRDAHRSRACARSFSPRNSSRHATGQSEIRLLPIQGGRPAGGATVRLWTTVTNPNPFGLTLSTVQATLLLDDVEAADADFPLGLPLQPRNSETIPLDLTVSFANVPRLANVIRQAASGGGLNYRLDGTVGIDAGRFGQPTFGPMTLFTGELRARF